MARILQGIGVLVIGVAVIVSALYAFGAWLFAQVH